MQTKARSGEEWNFASGWGSLYFSIANDAAVSLLRFQSFFISFAFLSTLMPFALSRSQIISQFDMDILSVGQAVAVLASLFSVMWLGAYLALRRVAALGSA